MRSTDIPLYFHPTTVCYVDDNVHFLDRLGDATPSDMRYRAFLSPEEGLEFLNRPHPRKPLAHRCTLRGETRLGLDLAVLTEETHHVDRFDRISVVVVDGSMPTMEGVEFCARLRDRDIKRILLTGRLDETLAVRAFNRGLIDQYLPKTDLESPGDLLKTIETQQTKYFVQYLDQLVMQHGLPPPAFTRAPQLRSHFDALRRTLSIVEFYLVLAPLGYLMLDASGNAFHLIIRNASEMAEDLELMEEFDAPSALLASVSTRSQLCYFYEHPQHYLGNEPFPWAECMFDATHLGGDEDWYCALVENPPVDVDFDRKIASYERYVKTASRPNRGPQSW